MQEIIIIAGPNGAGKTSFANEFLPAADENLVFVNADEIAREIADPSLSKAALELRAGREMLSRIETLADAGVGFMFGSETYFEQRYKQVVDEWYVWDSLEGDFELAEAWDD